MNISNAIKYTMLSILVTIIMVTACFFSYSRGYDTGFSRGYIRGQVELSLRLSKELGNYVSEETVDEHYYRFLNIKDISIYIYDKNGTKTIAFWNYKNYPQQCR